MGAWESMLVGCGVGGHEHGVCEVKGKLALGKQLALVDTQLCLLVKGGQRLINAGLPGQWRRLAMQALRLPVKGGQRLVNAGLPGQWQRLTTQVHICRSKAVKPAAACCGRSPVMVVFVVDVWLWTSVTNSVTEQLRSRARWVGGGLKVKEVIRLRSEAGPGVGVQQGHASCVCVCGRGGGGEGSSNSLCDQHHVWSASQPPRWDAPAMQFKQAKESW